MADDAPPYFDALFARLEAGDPAATAAFGRHVHWGYWANPGAADGTGEDYARAAEALCQAVCDAAPVADGMRVLDVGCGFGGTIASLNERFQNLDMVGVNIDPRQLARAADTVHTANGNRVQWVEADACDLPLTGPFDVVLAVECVFHFPSRAKFLSEMDRIVPWGDLCGLIAPKYPKAGDGRPPKDLEMMLRIYFQQQCVGADAEMSWFWPFRRLGIEPGESGPSPHPC